MDHDQLNIQSLSARRIFERLRDEHGYNGGETGVKVAVRACKQHHREVLLPLSHPPGEAKIDFGFADVWLAGKLTKVALFVMTLPYSDVALMNENYTKESAQNSSPPSTLTFNRRLAPRPLRLQQVSPSTGP